MILKHFIGLDNPLRIMYHLQRAILANIVYWFPSKWMVIIWVTGTNGKTTTTNIIARGLKASGKKVFMFSTVNYFIWEKEYRNDTKMTSPDPFILQSLLAKAKKEGCEVAVIETSSHALFYHRVWWINYDIAVLTNITQDHLDLHGTMEQYVKTKLKLFVGLIGWKRKPWIKKTAVINLESEYKDNFLLETYDVLTTYGVDYDSTLRPVDIMTDINGMTFDVKIPSDTLHIKTKLMGRHNIYNILASIGVFLSLWVKPRIIEDTIQAVALVPWRLEDVPNDFGYKILVDYAHTPDALENVLRTLRDLKGVKNILTVFGATWDRDRLKRPIMGEVVSRYSDYIILTEDDDYSEDPTQIIKDVLPWIEKKEWENFWIIHDRKDAIRTALLHAEKWDVILIAGKWDEHVMVTNEGVIPYNDRQTVEALLKEIDDNIVM